ncbi:MAG: right-handed parallel beta-helix repeat-containing protein [Planctomycetia bacterium]|nr:right-handed parallel beta-helix repeat-containing protein [Planctomycetia bacterium]
MNHFRLVEALFFVSFSRPIEGWQESRFRGGEGMKILGIVLFLLGSVSKLPARDIYVNNLQGNDSFYGITEKSINVNGPVRTIGQALKLAHAGDRIVLAKTAEPYRESVTFFGQKNSCAPGNPFRLEGNGAILDGSEPIPEEWWEPYQKGIFRFQPPWQAWQNLFWKGKPLKKGKVQRDGDAPVQIVLEPMEWTLYEGFVYFKPEPGRLPGEYQLSMAGKRHGVVLLHVRGVEIRDLIVQGYQNDGMVASNNATDVHLENVTLRGNARAGMAVGGACSIWMNRCTVGDNRYAQLLTEPFSQVTLLSTELISNTAPGWVDHGTEITPDGRTVDQSVVFRDGKRIFGGLNEPVPEIPVHATEAGETEAPETVPALEENEEEGLLDDSAEEEISETDEETSEDWGEMTEESTEEPTDETVDFLGSGEEEEETESEEDSSFDFSL